MSNASAPSGHCRERDLFAAETDSRLSFAVIVIPCKKKALPYCKDGSVPLPPTRLDGMRQEMMCKQRTMYFSFLLHRKRQDGVVGLVDKTMFYRLEQWGLLPLAFCFCLLSVLDLFKTDPALLVAVPQLLFFAFARALPIELWHMGQLAKRTGTFLIAARADTDKHRG